MGSSFLFLTGWQKGRDIIPASTGVGILKESFFFHKIGGLLNFKGPKI